MTHQHHHPGNAQHEMDVDMEYTDAHSSSQQPYNPLQNIGHYHHPSSGHHPPLHYYEQNPAFHTHQNPKHQFRPPPLLLQEQLLYPPVPLPARDTTPTRTESGESHRSQTRRFAAGHAEMQRSAFMSTQDEDDVIHRNLQKKSKLHLEDNNNNSNNNNNNNNSSNNDEGHHGGGCAGNHSSTTSNNYHHPNNSAHNGPNNNNPNGVSMGMNATNTLAAMDDGSYGFLQPQKRPRRFTKDTPNNKTNSTGESIA